MSHTATTRIHVVIPAAGVSRRMGQPKLLMQLNGETLIERLVRQLSMFQFASISVLARKSDELLHRAILRSQARLVLPDHDPAEMRESVELLIQDLQDSFAPSDNDGWLLIPADHPILEPHTLTQLIAHCAASPDQIVLPTHQGRRGHPTLFPWSAASCLAKIPHDQGLNWLTRHSDFTVQEVACEEESILWDIDTPEDFERICGILKD
ncbi:nucleotidyltransferase family protein [Thalassoglobus polymorphus]|uniref:Molybdenum cofactor cytidylyltransferase n=1 Tax=Thalassoglobus polymorphus TaxID=2527994 RepID=A0A517QHU2_9PLAN|nr:nucleotidyltransferase family protein [Thalassoglobus polymorphus]QDT31201.1 Molybdenum cofactor cytidylyltransferase [Thalassoglobus polymorphus]